jgi:hypothetical protein
MLAAYRKELANLAVNPSNPYMKCLEPLLEPPSDEPQRRLVAYYESLLGKVSGKKRDHVLACLAKINAKNNL